MQPSHTYKKQSKKHPQNNTIIMLIWMMMMVYMKWKQHFCRNNFQIFLWFFPRQSVKCGVNDRLHRFYVFIIFVVILIRSKANNVEWSESVSSDESIHYYWHSSAFVVINCSWQWFGRCFVVDQYHRVYCFPLLWLNCRKWLVLIRIHRNQPIFRLNCYWDFGNTSDAKLCSTAVNTHKNHRQENS